MHDTYVKPTRTLRVMKDLDGCYYDFGANWFESCWALGLIDGLEFTWAPCCWDFYTHYDMDVPAFLAACNKAADAGLLWEGPMIPGSKSAWLDLAADGHELHVKTDRSFGSHPAVSESATYAWLRREGLPFASVTFTPDKTRGPEVDVALEDKLANYDALDASGVQVWLIDRPWNQDDGTRRRVYNHDQFVKVVRELAAQPEGVLS